MNNPRDLSIKDFSYDLPDERIAQFPLEARDQSKLLVYNNSQISETLFNQLSSLLKAGYALYFNNTRVIHARIFFFKESGAKVEIMCLEPLDSSDTQVAFQQKKSATWKVMIGNSKRWKEGYLSKDLTLNQGKFNLKVEKISQHEDTYTIRFTWDADISFAEMIENAGVLPLPPYMNRDVEGEDENRYQTVYARHDGSVAAPTAGLHFTENVIQSLHSKGISTNYLTLHVGAGTFKPVKAETMQGHEMHEERIHVEKSIVEKLLNQVKAKSGRIVAVGTTSLRSLESIYWFGRRLFMQRDKWDEIEHLYVEQWEPYPLRIDNYELGILDKEIQTQGFDSAQPELDLQTSLQAILDWMQYKDKTVLTGATQIIIAPPYKIKVADAIITNFHQPESTLLLLVSAFVGDDWKRIYEYALANDFRFLSYGDSSILFRSKL
ncbi:MAG: S-adenosylmethionine:tRNA ribosyltransferase-isomerase [Bacteroidota bacterium]